MNRQHAAKLGLHARKLLPMLAVLALFAFATTSMAADANGCGNTEHADGHTHWVTFKNCGSTTLRRKLIVKYYGDGSCKAIGAGKTVDLGNWQQPPGFWDKTISC